MRSRDCQKLFKRTEHEQHLFQLLVARSSVRCRRNEQAFRKKCELLKTTWGSSGAERIGSVSGGQPELQDADSFEYQVTKSGRLKVPDILKRRFAVFEVGSIVVSSAVKLLLPAFFHSQFIERRERPQPFSLSYAS